jgi:hypothetical protein
MVRRLPAEIDYLLPIIVVLILDLVSTSRPAALWDKDLPIIIIGQLVNISPFTSKYWVSCSRDFYSGLGSPSICLLLILPTHPCHSFHCS